MRLRLGFAVGCAGVLAGCGGGDDFDPWNVGEAELGVPAAELDAPPTVLQHSCNTTSYSVAVTDP